VEDRAGGAGLTDIGAVAELAVCDGAGHAGIAEEGGSCCAGEA
jgi:hypothetical protein